jgi:hypothetical protein
MQEMRKKPEGDFSPGGPAPREPFKPRPRKEGKAPYAGSKGPREFGKKNFDK